MAECPGEHIPDPGLLMCTRLYLRGEQISKDEKTVVVQTQKSGRTKFDLSKREWCPYHEMHDLPATDMPDDVCKIKGFGEAALLLMMRKRFCDTFDIYTYVSDIVLCLNPYMHLPKMENIREYPQQVKYRKGSHPSSYATAHFAYWNSRDASARKRNNSCIVSGESGAGKTVACTFIMRYLARLSKWRKMELNEYDPEKDKTDIAKLVGGVSPFLEMFGNAKTRMNDNSSRFGKFTKIWFHDGKIIGAELVHYLLEKARLANQGAGERTYHVFYGLIRGATEEERVRLKLKRRCEEYTCIMQGGSSIVGHGHGEEYDIARFNNPFVDDDPDHTGMRAALTAAGVGPDRQAILWDTVAGILKLLDLKFKPGSGSEEKSVPEDPPAVKEVERLLGLRGAEAGDLGYLLTIFRIKPPKSKVIDSPVDVQGAIDNRNAMAKEIYGRVFGYLIDTVCNDALKPRGKGDAFVGLLDIFGFEVMAKNSIEQLCINFANEKLQQLFNHHVFDEEKVTYDNEGLSTDVIPEHADNTPCCNLVEATSRKFVGILRSLDDVTRPGSKMTDRKFLHQLVQRFGRKRKKPGEVYEEAKGLIAKQASAHFYAHKKKDYIFYIVHYAKEVEYDIRGFLRKNRDKLPVQLMDALFASKQPLVRAIFREKSSGSKDKTLASKYLTSLKLLAKTLKQTTPNYVRCVKPNGVHFRPIDGAAAFDEWRTYRQLLYAGVMEVVRIKNDGYPFRMPFDLFWRMCVDKGYHRFVNVPRGIDPKQGCEAIARAALKPSETKKIPGTNRTRPVHFWTCGKTLLFSKADTEDRLMQWHQIKVAGFVQSWWRLQIFRCRLLDFDRAATVLGSEYRSTLTKRRFAEMESAVIRMQAMIRGIESYRRFLRRRRVIESGKKITRSLREYLAYESFVEIWNRVVRANARRNLDVWSDEVVAIIRIRFKSWFKEMSAACRLGDDTKLASLIKTEPPFQHLHQIPTQLLINMRDSTHCTTFLHFVAQSGSTACARLLLKNGCRVDTLDALGNSSLHEACRLGDAGLGFVKLICESSSNFSALLSLRNKEGYFPCDIALESSDEKMELVTWLLERGADVDETSCESMQNELEARKMRRELSKRQEARIRSANESRETNDFAWQHILLAMPRAEGTLVLDTFTERPFASIRDIFGDYRAVDFFISEREALSDAAVSVRRYLSHCELSREN
eukprot:g2910.t1